MKQILTIILIIMGGILGTAIGDMCVGLDGLKWLSVGGAIGLKEPVVISLSFLEFTFGLWCKLNVGGMIGIISCMFLSGKVLKWVKI